MHFKVKFNYFCALKLGIFQKKITTHVSLPYLRPILQNSDSSNS